MKLNNIYLVLSVALFICLSCTDTNLYSPTQPRKEADRLAVRGRVCTEDPVEARFPVRVVLVVDQAAGPLYADFDSAGQRVNTMRGFVQSALNNPNTAMAIVGYAGRARKLAPTEGDFTRNPGELFNAIGRLSLPEPCIDETLCRDYREAIRSARTLIEGDLASLPAGVRVLTQYVVIMINAGPHEPLALGQECCPPDDVQCLEAGQGPSPECETLLGAEEVTQLKDLVAAQGAAGFRFHTLQFAAEPVVDGAEEQVNDQVQRTMETMAFAGGGTSQRTNAIGGFNSASLDLLDLRTILQAKLLMAANLNALPGPDGPRVDSDADGLSDDEEDTLGTSAGTADTDADGISDLVEILTGFDPMVLDQPTACANLVAGRDTDLDGLTDCDETLLGSEPSLVDTDGDGMPDRLEVTLATNYLDRDAEIDTDGDGVTNGDEYRQHSDPRSTDNRAHLTFRYRYQLFDEGFSRELFAADLIQITGVEATALSDGTTAGLGTVIYDPTAQTLSWQDAGDDTPGPAVFIGEGGEFNLESSSFAPIQGDDGRFITVEVDIAELSPPEIACAGGGVASCVVTEKLRVVFRERQCIQYTARNIQLVPTRALDDGITPEGTNNIQLFFAQAPEDRLEIPGPFRLAQIPVIFNPPATRSPDGAILQVEDEEFVRPRLELDIP